MYLRIFFSCLAYYDLDPCHYFRPPGLSWEAMLKMTEVKLEKISDTDKYMFFEQGVRGGISYINKRYSEAYENVNILYLDMNNLYGCAMSQYLRINNFRWVKNTDEIEEKLISIKNNSLTGYILQVDLEHPKELHDIHNDYLLAPEKINIKKEWLSDYCLEIANEHNIAIGTVKKLVSSLIDKNNYVIHYRNLQQCLEQGLKLKKIHRILKFKQSDWMKPYIDFNTQKRTISNNEPDKNFSKLMNNAVYGKTMENMIKRVKTKILVAIHEKKVCLTLNKPIYVGFTVLEIGKWEMYSFHYNSMVKKFNTRLLFADTDSLCYEIYGKNPRKKIYKYRGLFNLSNFPKSSKYYCIDNKKVVGKMKDEYGGKLINKCIGLKSKMYSILGENDNEKSTNNGHNAFIEFRESHVILFQKKILRHKMRGIKSKNQNIGTYESNKISLSCYDDKSYILRNGIDTLTYRHKNISFKKEIFLIRLVHSIIYIKFFFSSVI